MVSGGGGQYGRCQSRIWYRGGFFKQRLSSRDLRQREACQFFAFTSLRPPRLSHPHVIGLTDADHHKCDDYTPPD
jgi:hypothetical protein